MTTQNIAAPRVGSDPCSLGLGEGASFFEATYRPERNDGPEPEFAPAFLTRDDD